MHYLSPTRDLLYFLLVVGKWLTDALPADDKRLTYVLSVVDKWPTDALPVADKRLTYVLSVVDKWLTDALPVADKRLTYVLSVVDKWLNDALPVADKRLTGTYLIPVADGDTEGDESTVSGQPALQAAAQQRCVDVTATDRQHNPCHKNVKKSACQK